MKQTPVKALYAIDPMCVLVSAPGVIGRRMKMDNFVPAIPELVKSLGSGADDAHRAAVAITTTDLVSKEAALQVGEWLLKPHCQQALCTLTCRDPLYTDL